MKLIAKPSQLSGKVLIPASKSHTIRAVIIASMAEGVSKVLNPLLSEDGVSALNACKTLGVRIDEDSEGNWTVYGTGGDFTHLQGKDIVIDVGNSGTTARLIIGLSANTGVPIRIQGDESTSSRPMYQLTEALQNLGVTVTYHENYGKLPLTVHGPIKGGKTEVDATSSQFLSSLLINTPCAENDTEINVTVLNEVPYVEMTLWWLKERKINFQTEGQKHYRIAGGQKYSAFEGVAIPGDFSSASFFFVAAALCGKDVEIHGLYMDDTQGDKRVLEILKAMGADITIDNNVITISKSELIGGEFDINDIPDALPILSVAGCFAKGTTVLKNVPQARLKETDRIAVMHEELAKIGGNTEEMPDGLIIHETKLHSGVTHSHHDHRIVMSLAVAGLMTDGGVEVEQGEAMRVTFPNFDELMRSIGGDVELR